MSWSINNEGPASEVREKIQKEMKDIQHLPPFEDTVKIAVAEVLERIFESQEPASTVKVAIAGSQSTSGPEGAIVTKHTLSVSFTSV